MWLFIFFILKNIWSYKKKWPWHTIVIFHWTYFITKECQWFRESVLIKYLNLMCFYQNITRWTYSQIASSCTTTQLRGLKMSRKNNVPIVLLTLFLLFIFGVGCKRIRKKGEFVAGTFILTQKSLSEAPYRYAGVLRKALDNAETKDPPSKSDEEDCSVRYRIRPSGILYF